MGESKLIKLFLLFKQNLLRIYIYALVASLLSLVIPLGIQSIIGFAMGNSMVFSIYLLIGLVALSVALVGILNIKQVRETEFIQKKVFTDYSFELAEVLENKDTIQVSGNKLQHKMLKYFDIFNVQKAISKIYVDIPVAVIQILLGIIFLTIYDSMFAFMGLSLYILMYFLFKASSRNGIETNVEESNGKYHFAEWLLNTSIAKASDDTIELAAEADSHIINYLQKRHTHFNVVMFQMRLLIVFKVIITLFFLGYGTVLLVDQKLSFGEFVAVEIVIIMILNSVEKLVFTIRNFYETNTSLKKLNEVVELKKSIHHGK